jgi:hypothetical protein
MIQESPMMTRRRRRVVIAVATCLLSVPLTVWVVRRAPAARSPLPAAGAARAPGGSAPVALAEPQEVLPAAPAVEGAAAGPDSTVDEGASPLGVHSVRAAVPPSAPVAAALPQAERSRHDAGAPPGDSIAARLETRVHADLRRLAGMEDGTGSPMGRVASVFTFLEQRQCAGGTCQAAQRVTEAYLRARAALLRTMLEAFLASAGEYEGARERQALQTLHADFSAEMATLVPHIPMLVGLPEVLASTLRIPDYLAAPEDHPRALQ